MVRGNAFSLNDFFSQVYNQCESTHLADHIRKDVRHLCGDACVDGVNAFGYLVSAHQQKLYGHDDLTDKKIQKQRKRFEMMAIGVCVDNEIKCCYRYGVAGSCYLQSLVRCIVGYLLRRDLWVLRCRCPFSKVCK